MPTKEEIKQMEKFFKKPFSQIDEIDILVYRQRELERAKEDKGAEIEEDNWAESHGAYQDEDGWVV